VHPKCRHLLPDVIVDVARDSASLLRLNRQAPLEQRCDLFLGGAAATTFFFEQRCHSRDIRRPCLYRRVRPITRPESALRPRARGQLAADLR
jgi:hypothetical protein